MCASIPVLNMWDIRHALGAHEVHKLACEHSLRAACLLFTRSSALEFDCHEMQCSEKEKLEEETCQAAENALVVLAWACLQGCAAAITVSKKPHCSQPCARKCAKRLDVLKDVGSRRRLYMLT